MVVSFVIKNSCFNFSAHYVSCLFVTRKSEVTEIVRVV